MDESLKKLFQATQELRKAMERDRKLDHIDQLRLENHLAVLQMTYIEWKRRNNPPNPPYCRSSFQESDWGDESLSSTAS